MERMGITRQQALDCFASDDLIGIGMEADAVRRRLHPEGVVSYIIDRNINYTNFCTEYCTFCAFYRPLKGKLAAEGYILDFDTIYDKIRETVEMGGTGVLMQGGIHPDLKIDWFESLFTGIKQRFPSIWLHCLSASEILAIAEYSEISLRDTIARLRDAGLDSIPGGGAEILDDEVEAGAVLIGGVVAARNTQRWGLPKEAIGRHLAAIADQVAVADGVGPIGRGELGDQGGRGVCAFASGRSTA